MEIWTKVRRRVLTGELSKRSACKEYGLNWRTLEKMLSQVEPRGIRRRPPGRPPVARGRPRPRDTSLDEAELAAWTLGKDGDRAVWGLTKRQSAYQPKVRSPHNVALVKDLELTDTVITFQVKSTRDTGNHRDCCVFFNWQDPEHFYYVHLGAKAEAGPGK